MTITAWPFAFLAVLALFTVFDDELGSMPLATRALVVSGVLVTLMANVVMPVLSIVVNRFLAKIAGESQVSTNVHTKGERLMTTETSSRPTGEATVEELISRCHEALRHQSQGRPEPFLELWSHADDVTIMAAIGGYHVGFEQVSGLLTAASKTQSFDTWSAENLVTTVGGGLAVSVELERYARTVDGTEEVMTLRATQIYRHEDGAWKVIHRHGDVLAPVAAKW
jgi:ketosteroid isomerase-like protein